MQDQYIAKLIHCKSLDEFVTMFFGLSMCEKLSVLGDDVPVPKGTIFYRVRKDEGRPLEDENEWWLPPQKMVTKGRFNKEKSPVLYLGTEDFLLPTVAFNQQINAVVPEQYNILFLYVLLQMSKDYLVEDINMALKGILSKSKLEEKEFIIPPMDLQEQFSDFVKQVDKSKVVVASVR